MSRSKCEEAFYLTELWAHEGRCFSPLSYSVDVECKIMLLLFERKVSLGRLRDRLCNCRAEEFASDR